MQQLSQSIYLFCDVWILNLKEATKCLHNCVRGDTRSPADIDGIELSSISCCAYYQVLRLFSTGTVLASVPVLVQVDVDCSSAAQHRVIDEMFFASLLLKLGTVYWACYRMTRVIVHLGYFLGAVLAFWAALTCPVRLPGSWYMDQVTGTYFMRVMPAHRRRESHLYPCFFFKHVGTVVFLNCN